MQNAPLEGIPYSMTCRNDFQALAGEKRMRKRAKDGGRTYDPGELPLKVDHEVPAGPHVQDQFQDILGYD